MTKTPAAPKIKKGDVVRWRGENFVVGGLIPPIVPDPRIEQHTLAQLQSIDRIHCATLATGDLEPAELSENEIASRVKMRDARAVLERPAHQRRVARKAIRHHEKRLAAAKARGDESAVKAITERIAFAVEDLKEAEGGAA